MGGALALFKGGGKMAVDKKLLQVLTRRETWGELSEGTLRALEDPRTWEDYFAFVDNSNWFWDNYENLTRECKGKMVVVYNTKVYYSGNTDEEVWEQVRKLERRKQAYIGYIGNGSYPVRLSFSRKP